MKTIILYGSTYGAAKTCAEDLGRQLSGEVLLVNLVKEAAPDLTNYDQIIVGGSIYMGQLQKQVKAFCTTHKELIEQKPFGLFLCCGSGELFPTALENNLGAELFQKSLVKKHFGGELNMEKMGFFHKIITKVMLTAAAKSGAPAIKIHGDAIKEMAETFNNRVV